MSFFIYLNRSLKTGEGNIIEGCSFVIDLYSATFALRLKGTL